VSGGKGGDKKKYDPFEESIQKETDIAFSKSLKTRSEVEKEVRARRAQASK
jgi:hypothetical protein